MTVSSREEGWGGSRRPHGRELTIEIVVNYDLYGADGQLSLSPEVSAQRSLANKEGSKETSEREEIVSWK